MIYSMNVVWSINKPPESPDDLTAKRAVFQRKILLSVIQKDIRILELERIVRWLKQNPPQLKTKCEARL